MYNGGFKVDVTELLEVPLHWDMIPGFTIRRPRKFNYPVIGPKDLTAWKSDAQNGAENDRS